MEAQPRRQTAQQDGMTWGRRARRATAGRAAPASGPGAKQEATVATAVVQAQGEAVGDAAPAGSPSNEGPQGSSQPSRRQRTSRRRQPDSRTGREGAAKQTDDSRKRGTVHTAKQAKDSRAQGREARSVGPHKPRTVTEILAETWTEEKARKFVGEGFLADLSPPVVSDGDSAPLKDMDALREPLRSIRRNLADECMVEDDVADVMLLDLVMNALADRIEVYRLQAGDGEWADIERVVELRYKADRRLIETIAALKNA